MANLSATDDFYEAIKEIQLLIDYSRRNQKNSLKYRAFNKAATVLLCSKFESFIENFLEEYAYELIQRTTNKTVCRDLFEHITDNIINRLDDIRTNKDKRRPHIKKLVVLFSNNESSTLENYREHINSSLKMGKHGQKEIERLLSNFGFGSMLNTPHITDFFSHFNSLTGIRNNIIHQDSTPALTHKDVQKHLSVIDGFVREIQQYANVKLSLV